jgi:hypothetical protein
VAPLALIQMAGLIAVMALFAARFVAAHTKLD